jgi:ribosomal protein S12 methylthiotransferase
MRKPSIGVASLGCPKNTTDTEVMLGLLTEAGYPVTFENEKADLCLVNTCSFIGEARQESVRTLVELAAQGKELIIAGCLAQHFREELLKEIPEARAIIGTGDTTKIVDVVTRVARDSALRVVEVSEVPNDYNDDVLPRLQTGLGASAFLKIAEGCDHNCSFCIIPLLRGRFRSRSIASLVQEARILVKSGVKEIILVSQDSTYYGLDLYKRAALSELLVALHAIEELEWIRIMYAYPTEVNDTLLQTMADLPKVVKYIDIPLQHSHPVILKAMARPLHPRGIVEKIRRTIPDVKIRSTFIVGFPGETEEHFEHLVNFVEDMQFDRLGVFTYSKQLEVPSGRMSHQVPEKSKKSRRNRLMQKQHAIATKLNQSMIGKTIPVLIETHDPLQNLYCGRSPWDAPQIDNQVYVRESDSMTGLGEIVNVKIDHAETYDLYGSFCEADEPNSIKLATPALAN